VHGRTRCQFYKGRADWKAIAQVKQAVSIPVVANGDITSAQTARAAQNASGADGVMVGRGARGKPWLLAQISADLHGTPMPSIPTGRALSALVAEHLEAMLVFYGRDLGARNARKHLGWYLDDIDAPRDLRHAILTQADPDLVPALLDEAFSMTLEQAA